MKMNERYLLILFSQHGLAQVCYFFGDKTKTFETSPGYKPCSSKITAYSTCCDFGNGDKCLENGLCLQSDTNETGVMYRGGCTNKNWDNCPDICLRVNTGGGEPLRQCSSKDYCCWSDSRGSNCCNLEGRQFSVTDGPHVSRRKTPIAAIAGGVVGGVVVIIGLLGLCWWWFRRRRASVNGKANINNNECEKRDKSTTTFNPALAEVDAGPGSVLVESNARVLQRKTVHELPA
ncbi:hypothetical protein SNK04_007789 [Fusarium graminearum]